jgi:hypothetical protein
VPSSGQLWKIRREIWPKTAFPRALEEQIPKRNAIVSGGMGIKNILKCILQICGVTLLTGLIWHQVRSSGEFL